MKLFLLSSYPLSQKNNDRIGRAVSDLGGVLIPTFHDDDRDTTVGRIDQHIAEATIYLGGRLTQEQWEQAERLDWIHVPWAGVNSLMAIDGITEASIEISNSSGVMADSVADQVMAYLLMLNRSLKHQILNQQKGAWNRYTTVEHPDRQILRGKVIGILGYGSIGVEIAIRASAFGMRVIGLKQNPDLLPERFGNGGTGDMKPEHLYSPAELDEFLPECDFVVVALPLTSETGGSFGLREMKLMKSSAYLINISRGQIIRQDELIEGLQSGVIAGGAFDVVTEEPLPPDSLLWGLENVIITPHSSGGFVGFGDRVTDLFLDNLQRFIDGVPLRNRVDLKREY